MVAILSDIANFISGAIQWLTQSAPKAFRIIFFLVLLTLGALLMTFTIRMMGYHCNSEGVPYTVSALNIFGNWDLLTSVPDVESLQNQAYDANQLPQDVTGGSNINNCDGPYFGYGFDHGGHHTVDLAMPVAGQLVVFVRTSARRGDRADQARPWGYASLWDKYLYELESAEDCERAAAVA